MIENFLNSCRRHREMLRFSVLAIFIIWVVWQLHSSPYILHPSSVEDVRRWVASYGSLGPLVYIALYTVRPVLFFPSILKQPVFLKNCDIQRLNYHTFFAGSN
jgi:uncharacterized membrane protein YdjX (TVP38/TMEM64 family)